MKQTLAAFKNIQARQGKKFLKQHGLVCKVGAYKQSVVIKLLKPTWTNDPMDLVPNTTGIFFSVWLTEKGIARGRMFYNIHAPRLRLLKTHPVPHAGKFVQAFREKFSRYSRKWPNVSVDFGPGTLMEGWIAFNPKTLNADTLELMEQFTTLCPAIDNLLEKPAA